MPSHTANLPDTPKRVRHSVDKIVGKLNTLWNLDLPSIHGTQETALKQADVEHSLAKRCAGRIRYLCFRDCQLDKVISDFEEDIPRICSEWVWKPSQEKGTLPQMPVTKSFIATRPSLPRKHRELLVQRLFDLLDEEFKLARDSEAYRRTSFSATLDTAGRFQEKEKQVRTSIGVPRATASTVRTRQDASIAIDDIEAGSSQTRRSRETMKRKSLVSEKVQWQTVIIIFE